MGAAKDEIILQEYLTPDQEAAIIEAAHPDKNAPLVIDEVMSKDGFNSEWQKLHKGQDAPAGEYDKYIQRVYDLVKALEADGYTHIVLAFSSPQAVKDSQSVHMRNGEGFVMALANDGNVEYGMEVYHGATDINGNSMTKDSHGNPVPVENCSLDAFREAFNGILGAAWVTKHGGKFAVIGPCSNHAADKKRFTYAHKAWKDNHNWPGIDFIDWGGMTEDTSGYNGPH
jgi:hypothetical protein